MNPVDRMAWQIVKFSTAIEMTLYQALYSLGNTRSIERKAEYIGHIEGCRYIIHSSPQDLPSMITERLLMQGRFLLLLIVVVVVPLAVRRIVT